MDLGAQWIHGQEESFLWDVWEEQAWPSTDFAPWPSHLYAPRLGMHRPYEYHGRAEEAPQSKGSHDGAGAQLLCGIQEILARLSEGECLGEGTLEEWLIAQGVGEAAREVCEAVFCNDRGSSLSECDLEESVISESAWMYGEENSLPQETFRCLIEWLSTGLTIHTGWEVSSVEVVSESEVRIYASDDRQIVASGVVISVPLPVLQSDQIRFVPPLSAERRHAISKLQASPIVKVMIQVRKALWEPDVQSVACAGCVLPEISMPPVYAPQGKDGPCVIVGFASGLAASRLSAMSSVELEAEVKSQLCAMFGVEAPEMVEEVMMIDWAQVPHIMCGYTRPSSGGHVARRVLAEPHADGLVTFCGEATNSNADVTLQACMAGGCRAAQELVRRPRTVNAA